MTSLYIIVLNLIAFISLKALELYGATIVEDILEWFSVSNATNTLYHPWSVITYTLLHLNTSHLIMNLLWLASFGIIYEEKSNGKTLIATYAAGAIAGAIGFFVASSFMHLESTLLIGSSSASLAVAAATITSGSISKTTLPNSLRKLLLSLAILAAVLLLLNELSDSVEKIAAHIAGAIVGASIGLYIKKIRLRQEHTKLQKAHEVKVKTTLIEKANIQGYASLSAEEQRKIFHFSQNP